MAEDGEGQEVNSAERKSDLWNVSYIDEVGSKPHMVQASRKQKSSDEDASDFRDERKPGKRHRVSSSHDAAERHVYKSPKSHKQVVDAYKIETGRYTSNLEDYSIGHFRDYQHGSRGSSRDHKYNSSRRHREKDRKPGLVRGRDREKDRDTGRERKREKARYGEEEYDREREERTRRTRDRESRGQSRDWDRGRSSRQRRYDDLDNDVNAYHRHNRHYDTEIKRDKTVDLLKAEKTKTVETEIEKPKRDDVEQEDYEAKIAFQLAKQEEEEQEIDRIKEESRRRKQAILEKYKNQLPPMEQVTQSIDNACSW